MKWNRLAFWGRLLFGLVAGVTGGCHAGPERIPLDPISMQDAIRIVNANTARIAGTLRASGHVDGRFILSDGRRASFHVDGILFYLEPIYVRFDLKSFGDRKFLLGSNADHYWFYDREADSFQCGRHGTHDELASEIPMPPEQVVDALGLTWIPVQLAPLDTTQRVQRIVDEYQQILILERNDAGNVTLQKEYWFDRYWPRLVRRVVFRDATGAVEMESLLDEYEALGERGPLLPHVMTAAWPKTGHRMRFHVNRWRLVEAVGPDSIQFAAPPECAGP